MASTTRVNGQSLLDGSTATEATDSYFVGTDVSDTIDVSFGTLVTAATAGFGAAGLGFNTAIGVASAGGDRAALALLDVALALLSAARATVGPRISRSVFRGQPHATPLETINQTTT